MAAKLLLCNFQCIANGRSENDVLCKGKGNGKGKGKGKVISLQARFGPDGG